MTRLARRLTAVAVPLAVVSMADPAGAQTDGNVNGERDSTSSPSLARPARDEDTSVPVAPVAVAAAAMAMFCDATAVARR